MDDRPTTGLTVETRELLTVIREALDLPYGATRDDEQRRLDLRNDNTIRVVGAIEYLLNEETPNVAREIRLLRKTLAEHPVTYATREETPRKTFTVTARPWEHGWELHIPGVGVTQSKTSATDAALTARDFIAEDLGVLSDSFEIALDLREVAK